MAETNKTYRLGKAAREFNVSSDRIVDVLKSEGFEIEKTANTKLDEEMMAVITKKFQGEKAVKEKAIKTIEFPKEEIIEEVTAASNQEKKLATEEEEITHPIKTNIIEPVDIPTPKLEVKVVGKLDMTPPAPKKEKPKVEKKPKTKTVPELSKKEPVQAKPEKEIKKEKEIEKTAEVETKPILPETAKVPEREHFETEIPTINKPVQVGFLDLSSLNTKTKPRKKNKDELAKEKEERRKTEQKIVAVRNKAIIQEKVEKGEMTVEQAKVATENIHKTEYRKLDGPVIKGKMDLSATRSAGSSQSASDARKRKRKRIKPQTTAGGANPNQGQAGPGETTTGPSNKKSAPNKRFTKDVKKTEISSEEIEKQIKETLSRLGPGGKSRASKHRREKRSTLNQRNLENLEQQEQEKKVIKVAEFLTANELSSLMDIPVTQIISTCMSIGLFVSINQRLDAETILLLTDEFGYEVKFMSAADEDDIMMQEEEDKPEDLKPRSPIVTVMGHVDHGKTSLLDYIRKANVIAGEAGGITQHVGAYEVHLDSGKRITFLDTPGHEAFTAMRARGAKITDVAIIVIAADDSIMPQTVEAINHAQAAGVPMIFAINKIDKPSANPDKIREGLAQMNILVEEWGGKFQSQEISAKKGLNIELLLEKILIEAEMLELKANPNKLSTGTVIESSLDKGRGYVAKILIQNGTLKIGDNVVAGTTMGRVKAMHNERNQEITSAGPSTPVLLLGLNGAPQAGDLFKVYKEEHEAKAIANKRQQLYREQSIRTQKHITLDEIGRRIAIGDFKELNIIVKGDVDGSVEALADSLMKLSSPEIQLNVIHKSVGAVSESDVLLASASNAIIVAFQVRPTHQARKLAEAEEIDIRMYSIIYNAINEIKDALEGMLSPEIQEKIVANVQVREVFKITKVGTIAGCLVLDGKIKRDTKIRIIRDGIVIYTGKLGSLKRYKDDVKEVISGMECGLNIDNFNDIKEGDIVEGYDEIEIKRTLK